MLEVFKFMSGEEIFIDGVCKILCSRVPVVRAFNSGSEGPSPSSTGEIPTCMLMAPGARKIRLG